MGVLITITFAIIVFFSIFLIFGVSEKVYDTALYVYAETGHVVGGYDKDLLQEAFKKEKSLLPF